MKKIAFTLYMISLIIMFPLYLIIEFKRKTPGSNDFNPVSIRNDKVKTTGSEKANFSKSTYLL